MRTELRGMLIAAAVMVAAATAGQAQAAGCCAAGGMGAGAQGDGMAGMMARHDSLDRVLAGKLAAMNAARGSTKVDAMAAVINELVSQRDAMHAMMMQHMKDMQGGMGGMGGMGGQGAMGGMQGMQAHDMHAMMGADSAAGRKMECSMMKHPPADSAAAKTGN